MPDHVDPRGFRVVAGGVSQSWVDPADPTRLEFEYVQRMADMLEEWLFPQPEAPAVLHIGGGGMSLPRYIAVLRPDARQVVCEPDTVQVAEVLRWAPLPSGDIEMVALDGFSCVAGRNAAEFDAIVLDAFVGMEVPADLATVDFFAAVRRVLKPSGQVLCNIAGRVPFAWERRYVAGLHTQFRHLVLTVEAAVWKGRRFGNLVVHAGAGRRETAVLRRRAAASPFGYTVVDGREVERWVGDAAPFAEPVAPERRPARFWFS